MAKISDLKDSVMLYVTSEGLEGEIMNKKEFTESDYSLNEANVYIAEKKCAHFSLYYALECIEDDMHEDWLDNVMAQIPKEIREEIEGKINSYLEKEPTYYPGEIVIIDSQYEINRTARSKK